MTTATEPKPVPQASREDAPAPGADEGLPHSHGRALWTRVTHNVEPLVIVCLLAASLVVPGGHWGPLPAGVYASGVVFGAALALHALGMVVIYRSSRVINFAQVYLGAISAAVFLILVNTRIMLLGLHQMCGCLTVTRINEVNSRNSYDYPTDVPSWLLDVNLWLALVMALLVGVGSVWVIHRVVIRPFEDSSPLLLTVITIAVGSAITAVTGLALGKFSGQRDLYKQISLPLPLRLTISPARFDAGSLALLIALAVATVAVATGFRRTRTGVLMRGLADNPQRARSLGVDIGRIRGRSWLIAGLLSSVAGLLSQSTRSSQNLTDPRQLVLLLAALVLARQESVRLVVAAALALSVLHQSLLFSSSSSSIIDVVLFLVIAGVLLTQRARGSRVDTEEVSATDFGTEVRPTPRELTGVPAVRRARVNLVVFAAVAALGLPWLLSAGQVRLATSAVISCIFALSILVLTGWAGQISLGQFGFAAIGGYVVAVVHAPAPLPLVAAGVAGSVVSVVVGLPALRLRGLALAVTTLAFAQAVSTFLIGPEALGRYLPDRIGRPSLPGVDLEAGKSYYYACLVLLVLATVSVIGLRRGRTGRVLIASRDNDAMAQTVGIDVVRARLTAFAISGCLAAVAGGLIAYDFGDIKPATFGVTPSMNIFLVTVVGGLGGVLPAIVGAVFFGLLGLFAGNPLVQLLGSSVGTLLVLRLLPGGIGAGLYRLRDGFLRRVADRNRIHVPSLVADRRVRRARAPIVSLAQASTKTHHARLYRLEGQWSTTLGRLSDD